MSEPTTDRKAALAQLEDRWDAARSERGLVGTHQALRRRAARARLLTAGATLALVGAVVVAGFSTWRVTHAPNAIASAPAQRGPVLPEPAHSVQALPSGTPAPAQRMQLVDGSEIALLDPVAHVVVKEVSATRMTVALAAGRAHFEIVHREERVFRVVCDDVTVEVLGTAFDLERDGPRTRVSVVRGRVAVHWADERTELAAGEAGWFPKTDASAAPAAAQADVPPRSSATSAPVSWREPAEHGDFARAYALLSQAKRAPVDDVEELMLAADTARMSGHPAAALPYLKRVVAHHVQDARAPLAAFTLGGVLMQQLERPREAEAAYARARQLSPDSSLAQDALARQVEAAHRAGDAARAEVLAKEYMTRYPNGRRVHAVRDFGGLPSE